MLRDYYNQSRVGKAALHPLHVILPDQCVGEFLRMLANNDIRLVITTVTYPDQITATSSFALVDSDGERLLKKTA